MRRLLVALIVGALPLAGCSGGDDDDAVEAEPSTTTTAAEAALVVESGTLVDRECGYDESFEAAATCWFLEVPENYADPAGATLRLAVTKVHSTGAEPEPDPVVYLHGGPGGDAVAGAGNGWDTDSRLVARDIIVWDQRGAGLSEPSLDCPEVDENVLARFAAVGTFEQERADREAAWSACRERLVADGIDLNQYDTEVHANDLEALRLALGVDQWNLWGVSYGTRLALTYIRAYPDHVRTALLDSAVAPGAGGVAHLVASGERGTQQLVDGCLEDPDCAAAFPNFATGPDDAYDALEANPFVGDADLGDAGGVIPLAIGGGDALAGLFTALYDAELIPILPTVVSAIINGDYGAIPAIAQQGIPFATQFSDGAAISVSCADNAALRSTDAALLADPGRYWVLATESTDTYCDIWAVEPVSDRFHDPVELDIPVMVVAGRYDPVTPPADSESVAQSLPNSVYAEWDGIGHGVLFSGAACATEAYTKFVATAELPDLACAAEAPGPEFATPYRENGPVHAAAVHFDIHIPSSRSLKAKRQVVRPIVDGLRSRFKVSVAEVDFLEQWQRAGIGVALVAGTESHLRDVLASVERFVANAPDVELCDVELSWFEFERS